MFRKSQVYDIFVNFTTYIQNQFELSIKSIQCDHGDEFNNQLFHQFCNARGISLCFSCPQTSSQNEKSKKKICSINNIIRTLLRHASLPPYFWPHALNTTTYLLNILPSKLLGHLTPTHLLYHKSLSCTHLRVFGCLCFPLIFSSKIHKLQPRCSPCVFWDIRPHIVVTSAMISPHTKLSYLVMLFLMKTLFLFLNLLLVLLTSTTS